MRFLVFSLIFIFALNSTAQQASYGENRNRADTDARTMEARRDFKKLITLSFKSFQERLSLSSLKLTYNDRMVAQYGRGKASAYEVLPTELFNAMVFVSRCRYHKERLVEELKSREEFQSLSLLQLEKAIQTIARAKILNLDYRGYLANSSVVSKYYFDKKQISIVTEWHEAESYYSLTPKRQLEHAMIRAALKPQHSFWKFLGY